MVLVNFTKTLSNQMLLKVKITKPLSNQMLPAPNDGLNWGKLPRAQPRPLHSARPLRYLTLAPLEIPSCCPPSRLDRRVWRRCHHHKSRLQDAFKTDSDRLKIYKNSKALPCRSTGAPRRLQNASTTPRRRPQDAQRCSKTLQRRILDAPTRI